MSWRLSAYVVIGVTLHTDGRLPVLPTGTPMGPGEVVGSGLPQPGWSGFGSSRVRASHRGGAGGNMEALEDVLEMLANCALRTGKAGSLSQHCYVLPRRAGGLPADERSTSARLPGGVASPDRRYPDVGEATPVATCHARRSRHAPGAGAAEVTFRAARASDNELMLNTEVPQAFGIHRRVMPLPLRIIIRSLHHACEVAGALWVAARRATPIVQPERWC